VDVQVRPEVIYVENIGGNVVPLERVFFHIVLENKSSAPIDVQWIRFDMVSPQGVAFSGQYSGKALMNLFDSAIDRKRIEPTPKETLVLASGQRKAISDIFMDVPLGFIGENLLLEVDYKSDGKDAFRKASTALKRTEGFAGRLPFEGIWYVAAEHGFLDSHKRFLAETFAYDFIQIGTNSRSFQREGRNNGDYQAYGKRVLAAKEGIVVFVRSDIVENVPGEPNTATPGGNLVIIDHANDQYGYYGHLKPGSIKVKVGNSVRTGDPIGEVGNSGDSLEPNLHFHVMNNLDPAQADGVPVIFQNWKAQSYSRSPVVRSQGLIPRGEFVQP
jgi:murein DD-endopeptidase MepM/ murein hydrolase activator NlpD